MNKVLWIDLETTGLDPEKHGVIQIACVYEENKQVVSKINIQTNIFDGDLIDPRAMDVNKVFEEDMKRFAHPSEAFKDLITFLERHVNKLDYNDRMYLAGYNVGFDINFLKKWFEKNKNYNFNKYFYRKHIDVMQAVIFLSYYNFIHPENHRLTTLCEYYDIYLDAHDAMSDILATRELSNKLKDLIKGI